MTSIVTDTDEEFDESWSEYEYGALPSPMCGAYARAWDAVVCCCFVVLLAGTAR